jgi:tRNA A37 threonylcarbamoyladenosine modification protein TsaB
VREVLPLVGYKSLRALNGYNTLLLGLKMLPAYRGESYEEFYARVDSMPPNDQEKLIREAVVFVELQKDEVEAIVGFCKDPNGVPYEPANLLKLPAKEIHEIIVAVCLEIAKIKITLVSEDEKKN